MDTRWYDGYKQILEKFDYTYKGYNLKFLIPGYLGIDLAGDVHVRDLFKIFYRSTKSADLRLPLSSQQKGLITYLIPRSDYADLASETQKSYPDSTIFCIEDLPEAKFSPISITYCHHFWKSVFFVFSRSIGGSFKYKLLFIGYLINLFNQISLVEKVKQTKVKHYICFNSAYRDESLLTLYFKKRGIETLSMQHGIFCNFKRSIPFDIINTENMIADKLLCWGQASVDNLIENGFDTSRMILTGNPKYKDVKIETTDQSFSRCLVLLGRELYIETNNNLLELLRQYNSTAEKKIIFYIKKHPFLSDDLHKGFASVNDNLIFIGKEHSTQEVLRSGLVDFTIAVNTTAYYESLALGKISLRWTEAENEEFYGMDDKFDNISEFENKIEEFKRKPESEITKEMKDIIRYIFNPNMQ